MKKKQQQNVIVIVAITIIVFLGVVFFLTSDSSVGDTKGSTDSVSVNSDGVQEAIINVRGGYKPNVLTLDANKPTILKMITKNTFDCSASLVIPSLNVNTNLPSTGTTKFDIKAQKAGSEISGSCSMGMYAFKLKFI